MSANPFLIDLLSKEGCVGDYEDWERDKGFIKESLTLYNFPTGPDQANELTSSIFYAGNVAASHMQKRGFETMFVNGGEIELTVRNRTCKVTAGDIIHFGSYNPHRMHFVKQTPWVGFFNRMHVSKPMVDKELLSANCPEFNDAYLTEVYRESYDVFHLEPMSTEILCPKETFPEVKTPEFEHERHEIEGDTMRLKIGRWESDGLFEIWEHNLRKGFYAKSAIPNVKENLFYVKSGRVGVRVFKYEFEATAENVIHIPPYGMYELEVLEDAVVFDVTGNSLLQGYISDVNYFKRCENEVLKDEARMAELRKKYNVYITEYGMK